MIFRIWWDLAAGYSSFLSFFFREPHRALQDLYEDWSAIYRNRIPPYLTLPLKRCSQPPLCFTDYLPSLPPPTPCPFFLSFLFAAFIQSFSPSLIVSTFYFSTIFSPFYNEIFSIPCLNCSAIIIILIFNLLLQLLQRLINKFFHLHQ